MKLFDLLIGFLFVVGIIRVITTIAESKPPIHTTCSVLEDRQTTDSVWYDENC